jgi:acetyltransferase-like isoleucine patch superfamily enzyme
MAIIKKTIQNLKPGKQYLLTVRPKDADLNTTLDPTAAIRFVVPSDQTEPTPLGNLIISTNYKSVMISFNPSNDPDLKGYEYKVYDDSQVQQVGLSYTPINENTFELSGFSSSNVITADVVNQSSLTDGTQTEDIENNLITNETILDEKFYFVKVRSVDTSGNVSAWTPLVRSGQIPLIESSHIRELSASKITSGWIGAQQITLTGPESVLKSSTYKDEKGGLTATLTAGQNTVLVTNGTDLDGNYIRGIYPGMYLFIPGSSGSVGKFGSAARVNEVFDGTNTFTVTVPHELSGEVFFSAYAKGWYINGAGQVNFGGRQGITFDGTQVRIGSDTIIEPNVELPNSTGLVIDAGTSSLAITNSSSGIGLKINSGTNTGNNYWFVDGSFKVGKSDKYIEYNGSTGDLNIVGQVNIGGTAADVVAAGSAAGTTALQPGNGISQNSTNKQVTQISGNIIRTGSIVSQDGNKTINLTNGTINFNNKFTVDAAGNAVFDGTITAQAGSIAGRLTAGSNVSIGVMNHINSYYKGIDLNGGFTNCFIRGDAGEIYLRADNGSQWIKFENGTVYIKGVGFEVNGSSVLIGENATIGKNLKIAEDCVIGNRLRVNQAAAAGGTTVMRVKADGDTSTTRYPFVVEKANGTNILEVREDGRVNIGGSLTVNGTSVSLSGHTHSYASTSHTHDYFPDSGGTLSGSLYVTGNVSYKMVASGTGVSQTTAGTVGVLCFSSTATANQKFVYWKSGTGSSIRFKENIEPIEASVSNLENFWNLKPVIFEYNEEYGGSIKHERPYGFRKHFGFIAEEVEKLTPYLVSYDDESLVDDVKYDSLFTVLYSEVKKMRQWLMENHNYPG